jgi:hypothetical protein
VEARSGEMGDVGVDAACGRDVKVPNRIQWDALNRGESELTLLAACTVST